MRRLIGSGGLPEMPEERQARIERLRASERGRLQREFDQAGCKTCLDGRFICHPVPFDHPDFGQSFPCPACVDWSWEQREQARRHSRLPNPMQTFDNFNIVEGAGDAFRACKDLAEGIADWMWVCLYGAAGCGKTHLLNAAVNLSAERGVRAEYWDVRELCDELRRQQREDGLEDFLDRLYELPFLALDEMGAERNTPFACEKVEQVIDARYRGPMVLLVATNLSYEDLPRAIQSRFSDAQISRRVRISAPDYRPLKEKHDS